MATQLRAVAPQPRSCFDQLSDQLSNAEDHLPFQIERLKHQIALFERMYGMSSDEMVAALHARTISETHDIGLWLMQLDLLRDVTSEV